MAILFFTEGIDFALAFEKQIRKWLQRVIAAYDKELQALNYIFCSDAFLYKMNMSYLGHDAFTDVIAFDFSEDEVGLFGDVYISVERVRDNARVYGVAFENELARVMVHGLLHLLGYKDDVEEAKREMREQEDFCLRMDEIQPFLLRGNVL